MSAVVSSDIDKLHIVCSHYKTVDIAKYYLVHLYNLYTQQYDRVL